MQMKVYDLVWYPIPHVDEDDIILLDLNFWLSARS